MGWGDLIQGGLALYSVYNNEKARKDAKNNPGTAAQSSVVNAALDPDSPQYKAMLEAEKSRQYTGFIDALNRDHLTKRRQAAAGANFVRSEREDESRSKAIADYLNNLDNSANNTVLRRLGVASGAANSLSAGYRTDQSTAFSARNNTIGAMQALAKQIAGNTARTQVGSEGQLTSENTGGGGSLWDSGTSTQSDQDFFSLDEITDFR